MTKIPRHPEDADALKRGKRPWHDLDAFADLGGQPQIEETQDSNEANASKGRLAGVLLNAVDVEGVALDNAGAGRGADDAFLRDIGALPMTNEDRPISTEKVVVERPEPTCADCGKPIPCGIHTMRTKSGKIKTIGN